jgi:nicotinamide-nucleotide amidase
VRRLGDAVTGTDDADLEVVVGRLLRERGLTIALGESLTGGGVAFRITAVPGASAYFVGGIVAYTPAVKQDLLGVSPETIERDGVVSAACALEMAAGARRALGADIGLSLTGVAGPDPEDGVEPGLVWIGLDAEDVRHARSITAPADRAIVRRWAEQAALDLLRRYLTGAPLPGGPSLV